LDPGTAIAAGLEMLRAGADIVDVGGESTRPGSDPVDVQVEQDRTIPVIRGILAGNPTAVISIDTRRSRVAGAALEAGAQIINDVSGFRDDWGVVDLAVESGAAVIVMHMLGTPATMQKDIRYEVFPQDIYDFLEERICVLEAAGINPEKIVVDPGIGFGKSFDQNLILINRLEIFKPLGKPILVGASRKAFLGAILDEPVASARDIGAVAVSTAAILRGASMIRAHDVPSAVQAVKVADAVMRERVDS